MSHNNDNKIKSLVAGSQQVETELDQFNEQFTSAIRFLKKTKIQQQRKTLHDLPLFLLLGLPGSGKTSFLANSSLKFILAKRAQQQAEQIKSTVYIDWWATKEALFLDTAGMFLQTKNDNAQSRKLWLHTLSLLAAQRKNCANGVIVTVNVAKLLLAKLKQKKHEMALLKQALIDVRSKVTSAIPIYLIFTGMDCLPGFQQFFSSLNLQQREQYWGFNFLPSQIISADALTDAFDREFDILLKRLHQHLLSQLYQQNDVPTRGLIKDFPLQFEGIKKPLLNFIYKFAPAVHNKKLSYLRGVYFVSAGGVQKQVDRLLPHFDRHFDLSLPVVGVPQKVDKAFFIKGIFTQVIFRDIPANYSKKPKVAAAKRTISMIGIAAAIAVIAFCSIHWTQQFSEEVIQLSKIEDSLTRYQLLNKDVDFTQVEQAISAINALLTISENLQHIAQPWLPQLGIKHKAKLASISQQIYGEAISNMINQQLQQVIAKQCLKEEKLNPTLLYGALATYLMLVEPKYFNSVAITKWVHSYWKDELGIEERLLKQLDDHFKNYISQYHKAIVMNQKLLAQARNVLYRIPSQQLVLAIVEYQSQQRYLSLPTIDKQPIFAANKPYFILPAMYTRDQFSQTYETLIPQAAEQLRFGNWVLGAHGSTRQVNDFNSIIQMAREYYAQRYIYYWQTILDSLDLQPATDTQQLIQLLDAIAKVNSPINQLLSTIHYNTGVEYMGLQTPISIAFQRFNRFFDSYQQGGFMTVGAHLNRLLDYLSEINGAKDKSAAAFAVVKQRMLLVDVEDVFDDLHQQAKSAPPPLAQWAASLTDDAWQILLKQARHYIDQRWQQDIIPFYQYQLSRHYPFNKQAVSEVSLQSFNQFFAPLGIFEHFFVQYILPFIEETPGMWRWRERDHRHLNFTQDALAQLQRAYQIQQVFFPANAKTASIHFTLKPSHLSLGVKRFSVDMDDQHISYDFNHQEARKLHWPGQAPVHSVTLMIEDDAGRISKQTEIGLWAWYKLFSIANQYESSNQQVKATFRLGPYLAQCDFDSNQSNINPLNPLLLQQLNLPKSLG